MGTVEPVAPVTHLSDAKRKLLDKLLRGEMKIAPKRLPPISPRTSEGPFPLSHTQQQIWLHAQMAPDLPVYTEPFTVHRRGPLDADVLERCLVEIIRRHEIWRTTFDTVDGRPVQVVRPAPSHFPLSTVDVRQFPAEDREPEAFRLASLQAHKLFDLKQGPLVRALLVRVSEDEYRLYMTFHHIITDGFSLYRVFMPELVALYEAFSRGDPSPLPEPALRYADYALWQQQWIGNEYLAEHMAYWRKHLAGELPALQLPTDHSRLAVHSPRGATQRFQFDRTMAGAIKGLSQREGVTVFAVLLASFLTLLHRYSGQEDIVVGSATAGRNYPELERVVGPFLNTVPLRTNLSGSPSFRELLGQVQGVSAEALSHDEIPFEHLVKELCPRREAGRNPIFQVMMTLEPPSAIGNQEWDLTGIDADTGATKYDLCAVLDERPDEIQGRLMCDSGLFDNSTIVRMIGHWQTLLVGALANPDSRIAELPLLTDTERAQLLVEWNNTQVDYPKEACLHDLIEAQVERTPDAVAVKFEGAQLSYCELNARANQLAHHLQKLGVGPEVLVGISMERSLDMLVALLGILKAGGAYVPLDPIYPKDRLRFMVEDSGLKILVTQNSLAEIWAGLPLQLVSLDYDRRMLSQYSVKLNPAKVGPENLVYVLYTSGSTGKPKGVEIPHSALVNFLMSMKREPGFLETDTLLAVTTLSFDIAGLELYLPLLSGGTLVIASQEEIYDPAHLMQQINHSPCSMMQATPATWRALIDAGWKGSQNLKILCGGEALPRDLAQALLPLCSELWNMYGPTETTIWSTLHRVISADGPIPIGRPIANTSVFILDANRKFVPPGAAGELYLGGMGLARGYRGRLDLTRERFIPSPFEPNARLYRTGDLARWLPDGSLECLGRVDNQVKIRGFRIELGEVEAVLGRHEAVRQCVVVAREDIPGDKLLVAYLEPQAGSVPAVDDLRTHLKRELPDYMVPSAFVVMEHLPLTPNGKIDRKALPAPGQPRNVVSHGFIAPRDPLEQLLGQLWSNVLKVKRVGLQDNFFELGGHSLLAIRIVVEIERAFGKRLPLATFLQAPTVGDLAEMLRKENWRVSWRSLVPLRPGGSRPPFFLMHAHGGNILEYYPLANRVDPDQPVYALQARGLDGQIVKGQTLEQMAASYLNELRSLQPEGPYFLGGFCFGGLLALEAAQQLIAAGEEVALLVLFQTMNPPSAKFRPETGLFKRWWYRTAKRLDLERENLRYRGAQYIGERARYLWSRELARIQIAFDTLMGNAQRFVSRSSMPYILEAITIESSKALKKYKVRPYSGYVVLFRSTKQLKGFMAGPDLGWTDALFGNLDIRQVPGHQQNMLLEPHVSYLAKELTARLQAARQSGRGSGAISVEAPSQDNVLSMASRVL